MVPVQWPTPAGQLVGLRVPMVDQVGSCIRRMFETQRERNFPLPDYEIQRGRGDLPRVQVHHRPNSRSPLHPASHEPG
jgi:hypothetical protein